jgi:cell division septal protein FtsQ
MAVSAPRDKRFRRAHASPARRRRRSDASRRHLAFAVLCTAAVAYGGYRVVGLLQSTGALTITGISVSGATKLSGEDVLSRLDGIRGQNMLSVNIEEWRQHVLDSPWVEAAAIRRVLPGSVDVAIVERRPMGVGRIEGELYLVDERGGIIDEYGSIYGEFDLPLIDGLAAEGPQSARGSAVDEVRAALVRRLMASLQSRPDLAERLSQIDVTDPHDAIVMLKGDAVLIRVGEDHFVDRLQAYLDVASTLRGQVSQIDYVDVRFGERVYVTPRSPGDDGGKTASGG